VVGWVHPPPSPICRTPAGDGVLRLSFTIRHSSRAPSCPQSRFSPPWNVRALDPASACSTYSRHSLSPSVP
jgi:hypothetical protein